MFLPIPICKRYYECPDCCVLELLKLAAILMQSESILSIEYGLTLESSEKIYGFILGLDKLLVEMEESYAANVIWIRHFEALQEAIIQLTGINLCAFDRRAAQRTVNHFKHLSGQMKLAYQFLMKQQYQRKPLYLREDDLIGRRERKALAGNRII